MTENKISDKIGQLKCSFCGAELKHLKVMREDAIACPNHCIGVYKPKVWQALINGKAAQDALNRIWHSQDEMPDKTKSVMTNRGQIICGSNNRRPWAYVKDILETYNFSSVKHGGK